SCMDSASLTASERFGSRMVSVPVWAPLSFRTSWFLVRHRVPRLHWPLSLHAPHDSGCHRRPMDWRRSLFLFGRLANRKAFAVFLLGHSGVYRLKCLDQRLDRCGVSVRDHICFPAGRSGPSTSVQDASCVQYFNLPAGRGTLARAGRPAESAGRPGQRVSVVLFHERASSSLSWQTLPGRLWNRSTCTFLWLAIGLVPALERFFSSSTCPDSLAIGSRSGRPRIAPSRAPSAVLLGSCHSIVLQFFDPPGVLRRPSLARVCAAVGSLARPRGGSSHWITDCPERSNLRHSTSGDWSGDLRRDGYSCHHLARAKTRCGTG